MELTYLGHFPSFCCFGHHPAPCVAGSLRSGARYSLGLDSGISAPNLRGYVTSIESGSPARQYSDLRENLFRPIIALSMGVLFFMRDRHPYTSLMHQVRTFFSVKVDSNRQKVTLQKSDLVDFILQYSFYKQVDL